MVASQRVVESAATAPVALNDSVLFYFRYTSLSLSLSLPLSHARARARAWFRLDLAANALLARNFRFHPSRARPRTLSLPKRNLMRAGGAREGGTCVRPLAPSPLGEEGFSARRWQS